MSVYSCDTISTDMATCVHQQSPIGVDKLLVKQLEQDFLKTTVLVRSVRAGAVQETKFLLESGCNPNIPCGVQRVRPLMFACQVSNVKRRIRIVKLLLEHGADPTLKDWHGRNSLMYACALHACECVHGMLLNHDFDLSDIDQEGNTLLHVCAMAGDHSILSRVLEDAIKLRIEISLRNDHSMTPLSVAALRSNWLCVDVLHNIGARPRLPLCGDLCVVETVQEQSALNDIMHTVIKDMRANALCAISSECGYGVQLSRSTLSTPVVSEWTMFGLTRRRSHSAHARLLPTRSRVVPQTTRGHFGKHLSGQDTGVVSGETLPLIHPSRHWSYSSSSDFLSMLSDLYTVQKTPLFCKPQYPMAKIDQQWIEVIQKYSECETADSDEPVGEDIARPILFRTVSSPHGVKNGPQSASLRTRKLARCTTSPQFDISSLSYSRQSSKTAHI